MNGKHIALIVLSIVGAVLVILSIGKPREPMTNGQAVGAIIGNALYLWLALS